MTKKEIRVQIALGTITAMGLFLKMLSMQIKEDGSFLYDRASPHKQWTDHMGNMHIVVGPSQNRLTFKFNAKEEFLYTYGA